MRACASDYREVIAHVDSLSCACPYCSDVVRVAVKVASDYPARWLDKSAISPEHDPRDASCDCLSCDVANRERTRRLTEWLLEDHEALAVQIENDVVARSNAPTSRPPSVTSYTPTTPWHETADSELESV